MWVWRPHLPPGIALHFAPRGGVYCQSLNKHFFIRMAFKLLFLWRWPCFSIGMALLLQESIRIALLQFLQGFGLQGLDLHHLLQYLLLIADRHVQPPEPHQQTCLGLVPSSFCPVSQADAHYSAASASVSAFKSCRARLYCQSVHEALLFMKRSQRVSSAGPMLFKHIKSIGHSFSHHFHLGLASCPLCLCRPPTPPESPQTPRAPTLLSPLPPFPLRVPVPFLLPLLPTTGLLSFCV
jgi:hypothetical protein